MVVASLTRRRRRFKKLGERRDASSWLREFIYTRASGRNDPESRRDPDEKAARTVQKRDFAVLLLQFPKKLSRKLLGFTASINTKNQVSTKDEIYNFLAGKLFHTVTLNGLNLSSSFWIRMLILFVKLMIKKTLIGLGWTLQNWLHHIGCTLTVDLY